MKHLVPLSRIAALLFATLLLASRVAAVESAQVKKLFANPPRDYSTGPLWVWNDMLTEQQIRDTLRDMASQRVKQVWVHPRPGLMTPYLSEDWFRLWKVALKEAERLDMNVWIYDENSYPSGFAGGWVPELMPESRGRGLAFSESKTAPKRDDNYLRSFRLDGDSWEDVTEKIRRADVLPEARYLVASIRRAENRGWHGGRCYVDLLYPGVTEKFLEVTLEPYRREFGRHFGKRIPGSFTDEPELRPAGGLPWTDDLPEQFQKRWGYSLLENLPSLNRAVGDWKKVRHNYWQLLNDLFIERWARPYYEYCARHNLEFTGHYWEHEWPKCGAVPDNMAMYAWQQRPAIDQLMNQYREDTHAQFGNVRMVKELSSVANQLGIKRTLCETYGAGGWDLRFEDMKRIGDWLSVLGVNTINQHLSFITIRGARKRDHPQSFSYHTPWWDAYHLSAGYFARLSAALSHGEQVNHILVLEPTTTAWMYQADGERLKEIGDSFFSLLMSLEKAQIEYDLGCEDIITRHGSTSGRAFRVGQRDYSIVVIPPLTENLNRRTRELLHAFTAAGGTVLSCAKTLARIDGREGVAAEDLLQPPAPGRQVEASEIEAELQNRLPWQVIRIERAAGDKGILFHQRRQFQDGQLLFLVNTSIDSPSSGNIFSTLKGIEQWELSTGEVRPYRFRTHEGSISAQFALPPSGSLLLFLTQKPLKPAPAVAEQTIVVPAASAMEIRRLGPNVLTLDYVDITASGETRTNLYFYDAQQLAFQKNGMERNPWDSAVQFKDELISKKFPAYTGFEATYRFAIEKTVPPSLSIVIERPDLYTITCNGEPVRAAKDAWWLDKAFGRIDIRNAARVGENVVTIKASPFTLYHELEPAYVLGDFTLRPAGQGFVIAPDQPLRLAPVEKHLVHNINPDGTAWLTRGIGFEKDKAGKPFEDRRPFVVFDLGKPVELTALKIWNYNEGHVRDHTARGVSDMRISGSASGEPGSFTNELARLTLARAGHNSPGQQYSFSGLPAAAAAQAGQARYVRFDILSNHSGTSYPATSKIADNGFVGLGEVQFFGGTNERLDGIRIHGVSSELASHNRLAVHLVNGSGLEMPRPGWNNQGHPFYAEGVGYRQQFRVERPAGRYVVSLPDWRGSVARVLVNGKSAGHIGWPPWECDVTKLLKRGRTTIEVVVIGTLKNTLGPHHGQVALGTAWPSQFRSAPNPGPPPGVSYHTIGYGLFEPFVLKQVIPTSDSHKIVERK